MVYTAVEKEEEEEEAEEIVEVVFPQSGRPEQLVMTTVSVSRTVVSAKAAPSRPTNTEYIGTFIFSKNSND